jgi:tRNA U34 5-methylaminomethyl-2-thiouridine-forming methyltransferase MnmC
MDRIIIKTGDGSDTITIPKMNVSYHSKHGAIQESIHVFIEAGFHYILNQSTNQPINIFEMGFGTGLNAFLTAIEATDKKTKVYYVAVENDPLIKEEISTLNYSETLKHAELFQSIHQASWNEDIELNEFFTLRKVNEDIINYSIKVLTEAEGFHLIYYDAFAPTAQPELWTEEISKKLYSMLLPGGILVTYCSKGSVRRAMQAAGFVIEKILGPPGKREMVRATHPDPALPEGKATSTQNLKPLNPHH